VRLLHQSGVLTRTDALLNRGEAVHQLQRAISYGKVLPERGCRPDEVGTISGAHASSDA
jgi:hypothetical protein